MKHPLFRLVGGLVIGVLLTVPVLIGSLEVDAGLSWLRGAADALGSNQVLQGLMLGLITLILLGLGLRGKQHFQKAPVNHFSVEIYRQRRLRRLQRARRQHYGW